MQLSELLETYALRDISKKTNISEENLDVLFNKEFEALTKVKAMGFISIVEREFKADLSDLRKEAKTYYEKNGDDIGMVFDAPVAETGKSGKLFWAVLLIVAVVGGGWYLSTRFDQAKLKQLQAMIPFMKSSSSDTRNADENISATVESLSIEHVISADNEEENQSDE